MFDPLTLGVGAIVWLAFRKQSNSQYGVLTPEREEVYRNAIEHCQDPQKLKALAAEYEKHGLKAQAHVMRLRAGWRARTPEQKAAHEQIFVKALQSTNVDAILEVAKVFESMTATVKAQQLRERVKSLVELRKSETPKQNGSGSMSGHTTKEAKNGLSEDSKTA